MSNEDQYQVQFKTDVDEQWKVLYTGDEGTAYSVAQAVKDLRCSDETVAVVKISCVRKWHGK